MDAGELEVLVKSTVRTLRLWLTTTVAIALAACGGGGGSGSGDGSGSGGGGTTPTTGTLQVKVTDQFSTVVAGASVSVVLGSVTKTATTGSDGSATVTGIEPGTANVSVSKDLYVSSSGTATVTAGQSTAVALTLNRLSGSIAGKLVDQFGTPIANATLSTTVEGHAFTALTGTDGTATLSGVPTGSTTVAVAAAGFVAPPDQSLNVSESQTTSFALSLVRLTQAAGGVALGRVVGTPTNNGQTVTLSMRVIVVDKNSQAISTLTAADFTLQPCVVDTSNTTPECISSGTLGDDTGYHPVNAMPDSFAMVPGNPATPFAAAILLDESKSILTTDPTDARIFASKVFMQTLGSSDSVVLAAFADTRGGDAKLPTLPTTIYGSFTGDGTSYFGDLDQLANLEGGGTALYSALDTMVNYTATNAPTNVPNQRKAVVVFTDGKDESLACGDNPVPCRDNTIANAQSKGVDIFTIGLSGQVDFEAMAALADGTNGVFLFADNAEQLIPIYGSLGNLLSGSLPTYSLTWTVQADAAGAFQTGRTVLGHLQVAGATNPVTLPFAVRIY